MFPPYPKYLAPTKKRKDFPYPWYLNSVLTAHRIYAGILLIGGISAVFDFQLQSTRIARRMSGTSVPDGP